MLLFSLRDYYNGTGEKPQSSFSLLWVLAPFSLACEYMIVAILQQVRYNGRRFHYVTFAEKDMIIWVLTDKPP